MYVHTCSVHMCIYIYIYLIYFYIFILSYNNKHI